MKLISAIILSIFLVLGGAVLVEAKPKPKPKPKAQAKSGKNSKTPPKSSKNNKVTKATKKTKSNKNDRNARNSRNSRNDRNARNSRTSSSSRSSRRTRTEAPARPTTPPAPKVSTSATSREIIVNVTTAPIRGQARLDAPYVANARLGTVMYASEKSALWYKVQYVAGGRTQTGWIPSSNVSELTGADRSAVYQQIVDKNFREDGDFASSSALVYFMTKVLSETPAESRGELEIKRAFALRGALSKIGRNDRNVSPYVDFLRDHDAEITFNESTGEYLVSSTLFWNIADRHRGTPKGDELAWSAARNPLPTDCGGMLNCYIFNMRMTDGEYLSQYPTGSRAEEAIRNMAAVLGRVESDLKEQKLFKGPADADSKTELASLLSELRTIVMRTAVPGRDGVLSLIGKIGEAYK